MVITIRLNKEDTNIENVLSKLKDNKERAEFTKKALKYFIDNKQALESVDRDIKELTSLVKEIKDRGTQLAVTRDESKDNSKDNAKEDQLKEKWTKSVIEMFNS